MWPCGRKCVPFGVGSEVSKAPKAQALSAGRSGCTRLLLQIHACCCHADEPETMIKPQLVLSFTGVALGTVCPHQQNTKRVSKSTCTRGPDTLARSLGTLKVSTDLHMWTIAGPYPSSQHRSYTHMHAIIRILEVKNVSQNVW